MTKTLAANAQVDLYDKYVNDPRGRVPTGFSELDELLHRGGLAPSTLVLLGGRTRTRKTTVMMNMIANMLSDGLNVGLVGLDEGKHSYIGKLMSAWSSRTMDNIETMWNHESHKDMKEEFTEWAKNFMLYGGKLRPDTGDLTQWLLDCEVSNQARPQVVFIDYTSLLGRGKFDGAENQRIHRLVENLQVWTNENELIVIGLHQVGRMDEGIGLRYHGSTPMSLEGLKYGGEEIADIVLSTYRPSLDPVGNMSFEMARQFKGDKFEYEHWVEAHDRVEKYRQYTFLQVIKNRPGVHTNEKGIPLLSQGETMRMEVDRSIEEHGPTVTDEEFKKVFGREDASHEPA